MGCASPHAVLRELEVPISMYKLRVYFPKFRQADREELKKTDFLLKGAGARGFLFSLQTNQLSRRVASSQRRRKLLVPLCVPPILVQSLSRLRVQRGLLSPALYIKPGGSLYIERTGDPRGEVARVYEDTLNVDQLSVSESLPFSWHPNKASESSNVKRLPIMTTASRPYNFECTFHSLFTLIIESLPPILAASRVFPFRQDGVSSQIRLLLLGDKDDDRTAIVR